jgi:8-oxo-dGTP diphosphatase
MPITAVELVTDRLILRPLDRGDIDSIVEHVNDWDVARFTSSIPYPYDRKMAEDFVAAHEAEMSETNRVFVITRKADRQLVGCIGLMPHHDQAGKEIGVEFGYWLGKAFWRQGFATEAVGRLARFIFETTQVPEIWASVVPINDASAKVLDKNGFVVVGAGQVDSDVRGHPLPVTLRKLTRADWARCGPRALPILTVVACALIDTDGRVLLAQRPEGKPLAGLWEFPGGKIHPGESPEHALIRELKEELDIDVRESCLAPLTFASHAYETFHLLMPLYACRRWEGTMHAREGQAIAWVKPSRLGDYAMPPADKPLIAMLQDLL